MHWIRGACHLDASALRKSRLSANSLPSFDQGFTFAVRYDRNSHSGLVGWSVLMDGLKRVSVRIDHESGIVRWPIMWAQARSAVVGSSGLQGRRVEGVNGRARCRVEGQMKTRPRRRSTRPFFQRQEIASPRWPVAGSVAFRPNATEAERRKCGIVERYRAVEIGGAKGKVTEHQIILRLGSVVFQNGTRQSLRASPTNTRCRNPVRQEASANLSTVTTTARAV
jgi:hypothetical protein